MNQQCNDVQRQPLRWQCVAVMLWSRSHHHKLGKHPKQHCQPQMQVRSVQSRVVGAPKFSRNQCQGQIRPCSRACHEVHKRPEGPQKVRLRPRPIVHGHGWIELCDFSALRMRSATAMSFDTTTTLRKILPSCCHTLADALDQQWHTRSGIFCYGRQTKETNYMLRLVTPA